jgi:EmrB/QacA subfamily drug resistance transporter
MTASELARRRARREPAEQEGPGGPRHLGIALALISAAQLMVVLDASIVNVALPSIERALHFSPANLVWVINAYTLAFGGLLLLGGRTGDLFGRRRMFVIGIGLFTTASFLGGLATTEGWLIGARVLQGMGGAIAAPTALSLIASTFPEGAPRNRAMGVYAAMSGGGAAVGVLLGGILTDALSWRWVLFVNVPIGLLVAFGAPRVLVETESRRGRLDLPGALSATAGMSLIVFGLIHAASTSWGETWTIAAITTGVALLGIFVTIEARSRHALMPLHLFRDRNRSTAYATMLAIATAMFAMFYFLTLFLQNILGFSPLHAGVAYLPFALMIIIGATNASRLVGRVGPKALLMAGTLAGAGGLFWFSRATVDSTYLGNVLGPMLVVAAGMATCFVPLTLTAVAGVRRNEQGIASALLNSGQQVGGSLGLAVLGTIAATITRNQAAAVIGRFGEQVSHFFQTAPPPPGAHIAPAVSHSVSAAYMQGYTTAFEVGAGILLLAFVLVTTLLRSRPAPGEGDEPVSEDAPAEPGEAELSPATA